MHIDINNFVLKTMERLNRAASQRRPSKQNEGTTNNEVQKLVSKITFVTDFLKSVVSHKRCNITHKKLKNIIYHILRNISDKSALI